MIKKIYQSIFPLLVLKIMTFTLKFSCKFLQNVELKIEKSEAINGKNLLLDSLIDLLYTLKKSVTLSNNKGVIDLKSPKNKS